MDSLYCYVNRYIEVKDIVRLLSTLIGVFVGALLAYANQNRALKNKQKKDDINSCQIALFQLGVIHENLHDIKNELDPYSDKEQRHIDMPIIIYGDKEVCINIDSLTFLLFENDANTIYLLSTIEREYKKLISMIEARNSIKEKSMHSGWSESLIFEIQNDTDRIYNQFQRCYSFSNQIRELAFKVFKNKFKRANFVTGVTNVLKTTSNKKINSDHK